MKRLSTIRRVCSVFPAYLPQPFFDGADDEPKQTIDAKGMTFEAPKSWKSSPPTKQSRRAELKVEPIEGDDYPAELIVSAFPGAAGSVDANLTRWQNFFKDEDGKSPKIESKKVQAKNVEVTRAETSGHYYPASFGGPRSQTTRSPASRRHRDRREEQLLHQDGRSRQDDEEADKRLRRNDQIDQAGRGITSKAAYRRDSDSGVLVGSGLEDSLGAPRFKRGLVS